MGLSFLQDLQIRSLIYQTTDFHTLENLFNTQKITAYQGFDATGDSLHIGSLAGIMILRRLEQMGHRPIILLGGATTLVGDPSDKEKERPLLDESTIQQNMDSLKRVFGIYLKNPIIVNNADWLKGMGYIDFLRTVGRHFSVNRMLSFEFVKNRLSVNKSLSFLELNYMLMQGYDFYHLFKEHNCILQIGGSEQWGNIINGVELVHKMLGKEVHALTVPLITTASGAKMGKTADGKAIWLNPDKTSAYDYWQHFRNVDDRDVEKMLHTFTELESSEIKTIMTGNINEAKKYLADEVTTLLHGEASLLEIHKTVATLFEKSAVGDLGAIPVLTVCPQNCVYPKLIDVLVNGGVYGSRSEAKNAITSGAVRVNEEKIIDPFAEPSWSNDTIVSVGKKNYYRIVMS